MLIKNVETKWVFIDRPDDNDKYRLVFKADEKLEKEIIDACKAELAKKGKTLDDAEWLASRKEEEDGSIWFGAKSNAEYTDKQGNTTRKKIPVYNIHAQKMRDEEIPKIANGAVMNIVVNPYYVEYKKKIGVMLGLNSVQLLKYTEYEGGGGDLFKDESAEAFASGESGEGMF